jgi:hypothetical protein
MFDLISKYGSEIMSFLVGALGGGALGSLITLRVTGRNQASGSASLVDQSNATAGGDIVGRDQRSNNGARR